MARQLPRPETDLVSAAPRRPRQRRQPARQRQARIRRVAVARLLGAARIGDRLQARGLPARADGARTLPAYASAHAARAPVRMGASRDAAVVREPRAIARLSLTAAAGLRRYASAAPSSSSR